MPVGGQAIHKLEVDIYKKPFGLLSEDFRQLKNAIRYGWPKSEELASSSS